MALLSLRNVTRRFGGIVALDGVSLDVPEGQIVGLIGPNGAGKTTAFNVITRLYTPNEGEVLFAGESLLKTPVHGIVRRGIARAVRRGAKAELLLPGPTDVRMARWAGQAYYERLLRAGVRIRELRHTVLHTKAAVFDDEVAVVGSANLDPRSFHVNVELVLNVFDPAVARELTGTLREHWEAAEEIRLEAWLRRPFTDRALEGVAVMLRSWL